jgi:hypothetical protein
VRLEGNQVVAHRDGVTVTLTCPACLTPTLVSGCEQSPLGWYSEGFDVKSPATTAKFAGEIRGNTVLRTLIEVKR